MELAPAADFESSFAPMRKRNRLRHDVHLSYHRYARCRFGFEVMRDSGSLLLG
ncbi:hypothetical protein Mnod_0662 [Methylobacterium nodulans ORS 2060]|uniref:Uncharacterized protein n=2 Tax=Methylobacterium nodulans TaxID=114616 RepID=B8IDX2_METNO|nr:hypothetical protein Mnod_0662 [Methylobacterium nodulans ORS 2060]